MRPDADVLPTGLTMQRADPGVSRVSPNLTPLTLFGVSEGTLLGRASPLLAAFEREHRVFPATGRRRIYIVPEPEQIGTPMAAILGVVAQRLNGVLALAPGWNGANALEVAGEAVRAAAQLVLDVLGDAPLSPQFFPLPNGGVQFEWHVGGSSVEVEVDTDGTAFAVAEGPDGVPLVEEDVDEETSARLRALLSDFIGRAS